MARETWMVINRTGNSLCIGDLSSVPAIPPRKQSDLLRYTTKEKINQSVNLKQMLDAGWLRLAKTKDNIKVNLSQSGGKDGVDTVEDNELKDYTYSKAEAYSKAEVDSRPTMTDERVPTDSSVTIAKIDSTILNANSGLAQLDENGNLIGPIVLRTEAWADMKDITLTVGEVAYATDVKMLRLGDSSTPGGIQVPTDTDSLVITQWAATAVLRGTNLKAALVKAAALTPGGSVLSATNRGVLSIPPGIYDVGTGDADLLFDSDADYIDVIGSGVCRRIDRDNILYPTTVITGNIKHTDIYAPCHCTASDMSFIGITFENQVSGDTAGNFGTSIIFNDEVNNSENVFFDNCSFRSPNATTPREIYSKVAVKASFNQCHALGKFNITNAILGTLSDCSATGDSFGGGGTIDKTWTRVQNFSRTNVLIGFAGIMDTCFIECKVTGENAVRLIPKYSGAAAKTADNASTKTSIVIDSDLVADEFTVGYFVENTTDSSWHRITAVSEGGGNTTITVSPASATDFDGLDVRATKAPQFINTVLITDDTESINGAAGFLEGPCMVMGCKMNQDLDALAVNMITDGQNILDEHLASYYIE